jgi:hypothetical protein
MNTVEGNYLNSKINGAHCSDDRLEAIARILLQLTIETTRLADAVERRGTGSLDPAAGPH